MKLNQLGLHRRRACQNPPACRRLPGMKPLRAVLLSILIAILPSTEAKPHAGEASSAGPARTFPNVLLIDADDLGSVVANCYGSKDLATPNIERLAATGVRFTQMLARLAINETR